MGSKALVLGGGGVAGIAWETGLVAGLAEGGIDVADADLIVGTSRAFRFTSSLIPWLPNLCYPVLRIVLRRENRNHLRSRRIFNPYGDSGGGSFNGTLVVPGIFG